MSVMGTARVSASVRLAGPQRGVRKFARDSCCFTHLRVLRAQAQRGSDHDGGALENGHSPPPPPPSNPKGTREGDKPNGGSGGPFEGFVIFVLCVYIAMFPARATALESLPIDNSNPNTRPMKLRGASEGVKDDLETIRRLLRDLFMEQMLLRKRQDALDQPSEQEHSLVDSTAATALRTRWKRMERSHNDAVVTISSNFEVQGGYVSSTDEQSIVSALHTGPRLHSRVHSQFDSDTSVSARTLSSSAGISLWQAMLTHKLRDNLTLLISPIGARFKDIAQSFHASKGEGLLETTCEGPPLHSAIHTCGAAARLEHSPMSFSAAIFGDSAGATPCSSQTVKNSGSHPRTPISGSAVAQVSFAVSRKVSLGGFLAHSNLGSGSLASQTNEEDSDDGGTGEGSPGTLRCVLPTAHAGPALQRCDHCTHGVTAAWDTESGAVVSGYWLAGTPSTHTGRRSVGSGSGNAGVHEQTSRLHRVVSGFQSGAAMGVQVSTNPSYDGSTYQIGAHVLPGVHLSDGV